MGIKIFRQASSCMVLYGAIWRCVVLWAEHNVILLFEDILLDKHCWLLLVSIMWYRQDLWRWPTGPLGPDPELQGASNFRGSPVAFFVCAGEQSEASSQLLIWALTCNRRAIVRPITDVCYQILKKIHLPVKSEDGRTVSKVSALKILNMLGLIEAVWWPRYLGMQ